MWVGRTEAAFVIIASVKRFILYLLCGVGGFLSARGGVESAVDHPAALSAMEILSSTVPAAIRIRLELTEAGPQTDGYTVVREGETLVVRAARPRAFLYAAGEPRRWLTTGATPFVREPAFQTRLLNIGNGGVTSVDEAAAWVVATGCNTVHLNRGEKPHHVEHWKALGLEVYGFLYGCDPVKWGASAYEAYVAAHPSARGTDPGRSWEKGLLCPSDPATAAFFEAKMTAVATAGAFDGVVVTLWDDYGVNCACRRCRETGMAGNFGRQIRVVVTAFERALKKLGKKLIVRTWASGAPHFLRDEWVNAPGYASEAEARATWEPAFAALDPSTVIQTKVYNADCQPNPPFSLLLGAATNHPEIAEWQITGQTLGRNSFPSPVTTHTAWTMKRAASLVRGNGVCLYAGGYRRKGYAALKDPVNSLNLHVWRQLSWNPDDNVASVCREWATPLYGAASDDVLKALDLCERAVVASFSPLGLGAPTESAFAKTVTRREDLLRYTNRQYLEEGRAALEPTAANIARVVAEKDEALAAVEQAKACVASARRVASAEAAVESRLDELGTRLDALTAHLMCTRAHDGALWRLRHLRYLEMLGRSDVAVMEAIEKDFETIRAWGKKTPEDLGSPVPLMVDIRANALASIERILGPNWRRRK